MKDRAEWTRVFDEERSVVESKYGVGTWEGETHGVVDFDFLFWYDILIENGVLDIVLV